MSNPTRNRPASPAPPPTRHQLALMIWIAVFPTLTVLNLSLKEVLGDAPTVLRTLVLATIAVPIVIYGLMPPLQRVRTSLMASRSSA
jgi:antibiotic biosynthesis monooxygenase (ABM) superfamily enzyme